MGRGKQGGALVAAAAAASARASRSRAGVLRRMSSKGQFDGEVAKMYGSFFQQLTPSWTLMLDAVDRVNAGGFGRPKSQRADQHLQKVLDVAAGPGQPGLLLASKFLAAQVHITDISPDMVAQAAANVAAAGHGDRVSTAVLDMNDMSEIPAASIDLVFLSVPHAAASLTPTAPSHTHLRPRARSRCRLV